jgi:hypothetical protein
MRTDRLQRLLAVAAGLKAPEAPETPVTAVTPVTPVTGLGYGSTTPVTGSLVTGQKPPQLRGLRRLQAENAGSHNRVFETVTLRVTPVTGSPVVPSDDWSDAHGERAAIVEFDGGVPRSWAEAFARLDRARPPVNVPQRRWLQFIDDCGTFLDEGWPARAAALGWGPLDLFGCDRQRPWARIDQQGLLWLLNGRRVVALTADTAIIETPGGGRLVYRRAPSGPGQVLAWDLNSTEGKSDGF